MLRCLSEICSRQVEVTLALEVAHLTATSLFGKVH